MYNQLFRSTDYPFPFCLEKGNTKQIQYSGEKTGKEGKTAVFRIFLFQLAGTKQKHGYYGGTREGGNNQKEEMISITIKRGKQNKETIPVAYGFSAPLGKEKKKKSEKSREKDQGEFLHG